MVERLAWGMPDATANWFWLNSWSSRKVRTDSTTVTVGRFLAGRKSFISVSGNREQLSLTLKQEVLDRPHSSTGWGRNSSLTPLVLQ
jgi:hypothetical protein